MKLLIVDDEYAIRQGLLSLDWSGLGVEEVLSAENGLIAKEYLTRKSIDVVISDIRMPGLDGIELSEYVFRNTRDTVIILLTGYSDFSYAQDAIRNQVFDYILKPVKTDELFQVIQRAMVMLSERKYKNQIFRRYEETVGAYDTTQQILHSFRDVSPQMLELLTDMAKRYNQDISLNNLAEKYHFTSIYLSRLIKKETGYPFIDLLNSIRLMNAADLLNTGRDKIHMICDKTGFRDPRYFSQVFKRAFGYTPGEFRKLENSSKTYNIIEVLDLISRVKQSKT